MKRKVEFIKIIQFESYNKMAKFQKSINAWIKEFS